MDAPDFPLQRPQSRDWSIGQRVLIALLTAYKGLVSPMFAGACRFQPSCSEYAREAIIEHGAFRGSWLAARRLARCHPMGSYGLDPVPPGSRASQS